MSDLIDRQAALDALRTCYDTDRIDMDNGDEYIDYNDAVGEIEELPSAQPMRKRGRWIDETFKPWGLVHHPYKCDQCGEHSEANSNFCPNCGCRMMRGDAE